MAGIGSMSGLVLGLTGALAVWSTADTMKGRVVGTGSQPLAGAKVAFVRLGLLATTAADGTFEMTVPGTGLILKNGTRVPGLTLAAEKDLELAGARDVLGKSAAGSTAYNRVLVLDGRGAMARHGALETLGEGNATSPAIALSKSAAAGDSLVFNKVGWFQKKLPLPLASQDMGDILLDRNIVGVGNVSTDKYDQQIMDAYKKQGIDSSLAMVVKAMIDIESSGNPQAISRYDTELPCGTHSYGLIQVTPGCEKGYATLSAGTKVTATISGGLNTQPAVLAWNDPADKASGNTIVQEAGIIINLITNPSNPLWPTSAYNPAYAIDHGTKALKDVMAEMKAFAGCTNGNYVAMALAGYNQGSGTVKGCTTYSTNGQAYSDKVLAKYREYCKSAGVTAIY